MQANAQGRTELDDFVGIAHDMKAAYAMVGGSSHNVLDEITKDHWSTISNQKIQPRHGRSPMVPLSANI